MNSLSFDDSREIGDRKYTSDVARLVQISTTALDILPHNLALCCSLNMNISEAHQHSGTLPVPHNDAGKYLN